MKRNSIWMMISVLSLLFSCEILDDNIERHETPEDSAGYVGLDEVAALFAALPIDDSHIHEVHDAVTSSAGNGYDEEYTMRNLFESPGSGVGEVPSKGGRSYSSPLRDLVRRHLDQNLATKSAGGPRMTPDEYIRALTSSDIQIYWPFSEEWDGKQLPIVTFDPLTDGAVSNIGYEMIIDDNGSRHVREIEVDEALARKRPVWVFNSNTDAGYTTLEMLRREDPQWGEGGGSIVIGPSGMTGLAKSGDALKTLVLKDFTMKRHYDSWFAGASEFFVKTGFVEDFTASTEAELRLYNPTVTDFMVVVRRNQLDKKVPFNAILVSDWSEQMTHCAFMITEDDGGTQTNWTTKALVKIASKSYGIEITLPVNTRDDIVWRGQLASTWFEENDDVTGHFGDVDLTFEIL